VKNTCYTDNFDMKKIQFITVCSILFSFLAACSSSRKIQPEVKEAKPEAVFEKELKDITVVDLPRLFAEHAGKPLPEVVTASRKKVNAIVSGNNLDGIGFIINENTPDIVGHLVAEARLIKPYLVTGVLFKDNPSLEKAVYHRNGGVADIVMLWSEADKSFPEKITFSENEKRRSPRNVFGLDLSAFFQGDPGGKPIYVNNGSIPSLTDSEGKIGFVTLLSDTVILRIGERTVTLSTADWNIPFRYAITYDNKAERRLPWVEFRSIPSAITDRAEYDFLCKTDYPARVSINGDTLKQYKTGIFFNKVSLKEGSNRVRATVVTPDSQTVFCENEFIYRKTDRTRKAFPLWISERSIEPAWDLELLPEDFVRVSFQGSLAQEGYIEVDPGKILIRCSREDFEDYSIYRGEIPLKNLKKGKPLKLILGLTPSSGSPDTRSLELILNRSVIVRESDDFPYIKVAKENARLIYNLGAPRLGGPIRSEIGPGPVLKVNGKFGDNYRVRLSNIESGFINQNEVQIMPLGTIRPSYYIASMSCGPVKDGDILTIPYPEPVPFEVYPDPDRQRIVITLFGVETSSTWITHLAARKIIEKVTWEQTTPETYKVYVNLNTRDIWGYSFRTEGRRLVLRIKDHPEYDINNIKPLAGLKIAVEAGHGGTGLGAVGLSGMLEKDVNLDLSLRLGELLKMMGAEIVQVRDSDKDMTLIEKRNIVISSDADLFVSIHANAGGGGYLRVAGTSTYYNNPFWAPLAETIYDRLLELKLKEFGVIGSFNYTPIRLSEMPSILVEQAFMSNAEDEEKLADPEFRQQMAVKISEGIIDYLKLMK
jgi:N-acetylmuramoyl-L-alanine amidase